MTTCPGSHKRQTTNNPASNRNAETQHRGEHGTLPTNKYPVLHGRYPPRTLARLSRTRQGSCPAGTGRTCAALACLFLRPPFCRCGPSRPEGLTTSRMTCRFPQGAPDPSRGRGGRIPGGGWATCASGGSVLRRKTVLCQKIVESFWKSLAICEMWLERRPGGTRRGDDCCRALNIAKSVVDFREFKGSNSNRYYPTLIHRIAVYSAKIPQILDGNHTKRD